MVLEAHSEGKLLCATGLELQICGMLLSDACDCLVLFISSSSSSPPVSFSEPHVSPSERPLGQKHRPCSTTTSFSTKSRTTTGEHNSLSSLFLLQPIYTHTSALHAKQQAHTINNQKHTYLLRTSSFSSSSFLLLTAPGSSSLSSS